MIEKEARLVRCSILNSLKIKNETFYPMSRFIYLLTEWFVNSLHHGSEGIKDNLAFR